MTDLENRLRAALRSRADGISHADLRPDLPAARPRRRQLLAAVAAAAAVLLLGSVALIVHRSTAHSSTAQPGGQIIGVHWVPESVMTSDGTMTLDAGAASIEFRSDGQVRIDDGCDPGAAFGPYRLTAASAIIDRLTPVTPARATSLIADPCAANPATTGPVRAALRSIAAGSSALVSDEGLRMTTSAGTLAFHADGAQFPEPSTGLLDAWWRLDRVVSGSTTTSIPASAGMIVSYGSDGQVSVALTCWAAAGGGGYFVSTRTGLQITSYESPAAGCYFQDPRLQTGYDALQFIRSNSRATMVAGHLHIDAGDRKLEFVPTSRPELTSDPVNQTASTSTQSRGVTSSAQSSTKTSVIPPPAMPPCTPPPFTSLDGPRTRSVGPGTPNPPQSLSTGQDLVLSLGYGCDVAADVTVSGPLRITERLPAPLPHSGWDAVRVLATAVGTGKVTFTGRRTCSTQGVTAGMCFGDPIWHRTIMITITN